MLLRHLWSAALLAVSLPVSAANVVPNPGFDDPDVEEWMPGIVSAVDWSTRDEQGSASSGSMRFQDFGLGSNRVQICVPAVAGRTYAYGGSALLPFPGKLSQSAGALVQWWSGPDCSGSDITAEFAGMQVFLRESWGPIQGSSTAPSGTQSATLQFTFGAASRTGFEVFLDNVFFIEDETCVTTHNAICLNDDRFLVTAEWLTGQGSTGYGRAVRITDESGYFWFFNAENVEIVAKLIDACPTQFDRFWFFASGLTDVETKLRVFDTLRDAERVYTNPLHTPFAAIQDTDAFETCP